MSYVNIRSVTAIGILFPILILGSWCLRLLVWMRHSHGSELDDIFAIPAVGFTIAGGVGLIIGAQMGFIGGQGSTPLQYIPEETMKQRNVEIAEIAYYMGNVVSIGFTRVTILLYFRRILGAKMYMSAFDISNWTLILLNLCWTLTFFFAELFGCGIHFSDLWSSLTPEDPQCINLFKVVIASSVLSWILDLAVLIEPLVMVSRLRIKPERKIQISLIFALAIFAVAASFAKMVVVLGTLTINLASPPKTVLGIPVEDSIEVDSVIIFWSYIEMGVGCLVACLLPCRRYFSKISLGFLSPPTWSMFSNRQSTVPTTHNATEANYAAQARFNMQVPPNL